MWDMETRTADLVMILVADRRGCIANRMVVVGWKEEVHILLFYIVVS